MIDLLVWAAVIGLVFLMPWRVVLKVTIRRKLKFLPIYALYRWQVRAMLRLYSSSPKRQHCYLKSFADKIIILRIATHPVSRTHRYRALTNILTFVDRQLLATEVSSPKAVLPLP